MSIYSDHNCGAMDDQEFHYACVRENRKEHENYKDFCKYELNPDKTCLNCVFMKNASRADGDDLCICTYDENDFNVVEHTDYCDLWECGQ